MLPDAAAFWESDPPSLSSDEPCTKCFKGVSGALRRSDRLSCCLHSLHCSLLTVSASQLSDKRLHFYCFLLNGPLSFPIEWNQNEKALNRTFRKSDWNRLGWNGKGKALFNFDWGKPIRFFIGDRMHRYEMLEVPIEEETLAKTFWRFNQLMQGASFCLRSYFSFPKPEVKGWCSSFSCLPLFPFILYHSFLTVFFQAYQLHWA